MLPSSPHVRDVSASGVPVYGYNAFQQRIVQVYENSVFAAAKPGALLIDCSTIDPTVTRALNASATTRKLRMIDAPVSGGVGGAEAGTLTFMVGGVSADFETAKTVLQAMGKNIVHCGAPGTGQIAKLCNNLVLGISMNAVSEAMNLGVKLGADPKVLAAIINTSSGRCWSSEVYNPVPGVLPNVPSSRGYTGGFGSALMAKDIGLALDAAKSAGVPLPTGATAFNIYQIMLSQGMGGKDFSAVYAFLRGNKEETQ
jgi:3-hydroxyisobutyrate dehydrogenase